jgi:hypothetical protein
MCTISRAKIIIAGVSIGSTLYNIPRWFDFRPEMHFSPSVNETIISVMRTRFSQNPLYLKVYFSWLYVPMMAVLPLLLLSFLNTFLILAVRRSKRQRKDMNVRQSRENNITIMLVSVVIVFIICQVPALVYNIAFAINNRYVEVSFGYQVLSKIRNFLVTLNSAVNFLLYCALGQKFRRIFLHIFFRKCVQESYIPMSGVHGQSTVVTMASGHRRVLCRTTLSHAHPPANTRGHDNGYGAACKAGFSAKDCHTYAPKFKPCDSEVEDTSYEQLLTDKTRNVFPLYKTKSGHH